MFCVIIWILCLKIDKNWLILVMKLISQILKVKWELKLPNLYQLKPVKWLEAFHLRLCYCLFVCVGVGGGVIITKDVKKIAKLFYVETEREMGSWPPNSLLLTSHRQWGPDKDTCQRKTWLSPEAFAPIPWPVRLRPVYLSGLILSGIGRPKTSYFSSAISQAQDNLVVTVSAM